MNRNNKTNKDETKNEDIRERVIDAIPQINVADRPTKEQRQSSKENEIEDRKERKIARNA